MSCTRMRSATSPITSPTKRGSCAHTSSMASVFLASCWPKSTCGIPRAFRSTSSSTRPHASSTCARSRSGVGGSLVHVRSGVRPAAPAPAAACRSASLSASKTSLCQIWDVSCPRPPASSASSDSMKVDRGTCTASPCAAGSVTSPGVTSVSRIFATPLGSSSSSASGAGHGGSAPAAAADPTAGEATASKSNVCKIRSTSPSTNAAGDTVSVACSTSSRLLLHTQSAPLPRSRRPSPASGRGRCAPSSSGGRTARPCCDPRRALGPPSPATAGWRLRSGGAGPSDTAAHAAATHRGSPLSDPASCPARASPTASSKASSSSNAPPPAASASPPCPPAASLTSSASSAECSFAIEDSGGAGDETAGHGNKSAGAPSNWASASGHAPSARATCGAAHGSRGKTAAARLPDRGRQSPASSAGAGGLA
eukprot:scaffold1756_cov117-Isochrysis_galbana.AAC.15